MTKNKAKKRLIIVHGWEGYPKEGWYPWLKKEMEKRGWEVQVPTMPSTNRPKIFEWLPFLQQTVGKADGSVFLVGHSLGCITILRFLENLQESKLIGGAILIAGFDNPIMHKELKNFFEEPIAWEKIKKKCKKFVSIHSTDDPYVPIENSSSFKKNLGAKTIVTSGFRHFSGEDGITFLPAALEELLKISK